MVSQAVLGLICKIIKSKKYLLTSNKQLGKYGLGKKGWDTDCKHKNLLIVTSSNSSVFDNA